MYNDKKQNRIEIKKLNYISYIFSSLSRIYIVSASYICTTNRTVLCENTKYNTDFSKKLMSSRNML